LESHASQGERMTKSQINKLGEKLRTALELDGDTLARLQRFRASYDEPMLRVQALLRDAGFESTSRLKTTNTIIEKLRRERTRLAEMQDIGGLRIVSEVDLAGQDEIVSRITSVVSITKVIDRRKSPSYGYRAVHIIATLEERPVEIQVRTQLQDLWAQAMERLADEVGREIRYGGKPQTRIEAVEGLLEISRVIAETEGMLTEINQLESELPQSHRAASKQHELRLLRTHIELLRRGLDRQTKTICAMLKVIIASGGTLP